LALALVQWLAGSVLPEVVVVPVVVPEVFVCEFPLGIEPDVLPVAFPGAPLDPAGPKLPVAVGLAPAPMESFPDDVLVEFVFVEFMPLPVVPEPADGEFAEEPAKVRVPSDTPPVRSTTTSYCLLPAPAAGPGPES
jgi:hypothetical protein